MPPIARQITEETLERNLINFLSALSSLEQIDIIKKIGWPEEIISDNTENS